MNDIIWWTGAIAWGVGGLVTFLIGAMWLWYFLIDRILMWNWSKAEFIAFVRERLKSGETKVP